MKIRLEDQNDRFTLMIADNGKGFVMEENLRQKNSFGYKLLEQDIQSIGAELNLASTPGAGTTVTVTVKKETRQTA